MPKPHAPHNHILLVDDDAILLKSLASALEDEGFEVRRATDGDAGLKLAKERQPDLLLLDIYMPKKSGLDVLKKLRTLSWGKDIPTILFTVVQPDNAIMEEIIKCAPSYYLIKAEWTIEKVVEKVKEVIADKYPL